MNKGLRCEKYVIFDHNFGSKDKNPYESKVIYLTVASLIVMIVEVVAGYLTGSMALLSDGIHMATHVLALGLAAFAFIFARQNSKNRSFSFGTGKIGELAGFTSAIILGLSALLLAFESAKRLITPEFISYKEAMVVALIGFVFNTASAYFLIRSKSHDNHDDCSLIHQCKHDNNLQAAFAHIVSDAITSIAAIVAIFGAWVFGYNWLDPLVGLMTSGVIVIWSTRLSYA
ncbi:MAG: cation diffusion facilitator family transporter, partial [Thermodesulfovibrionales bacterium]|nr:cation diffusion facilitator family transporter [Thermodesulfovibrionales bacterium]